MKLGKSLSILGVATLALVACQKADQPLGGGHFLMWYNPQHAVYKSTDGRNWVKLNDTKEWASWLSAGADGMLYASKMGKSPIVASSKDGKDWVEVKGNSANVQGDRRTFAICTGSGKTIYALSSHGDFQVSKDGGVTWEEKTRPVPVGARGAGDGFRGFCSVSPTGDQILIQGWYFSPANPILAVTADEGKTWTPIKAPTDRNEANGVGYLSNGATLFFANSEAVYTSADKGATWKKSTPEKLLAKNSERNFYSYRRFASNGGSVIVGVEAAGDGKDAKNKWPGATFFSKDGGLTFEVIDLPWSTDPTPKVSDELLEITFVPGK
ncbi:MAG: Photosynthesis system assembly factor [Proteobacteria bacterium]|nr:Photosynthesis system assembly factor [Pseudomonadota bacterium]